MELLFLFISTVLLLLLPISRAQDDSYFSGKCAPITCGNITVTFPFTSSESFCGLPGYEINCDHSSSIPTITLSGNPYRVKQINRNDSLILLTDARLTDALTSNKCDSSSLRSHFLPAAQFSPLHLPYWGTILNFSWCPLNAGDDEYVRYCGGNESLHALPAGTDGVIAASCSWAGLPVPRTSILNKNVSHVRGDLLFVVGDGFPLLWKNISRCWDCEEKGGRCGYNQTTYNETTQEVNCFCPKDGCGVGGGPSTGRFNKWKIIVATVVPATVIFLAGGLAYLKFRKKGSSIFSSFSIKSTSQQHNVDVDEFIRTYRSMLTTEYPYFDLRKITDDFKEKLGEGGYGNVFKGRLPNGLLVAVKTLEKSKDNGQDFMSEVATIGMIHHVNIIRLLGYCCDGSHRALIYEYMPKGSLGDLISKEEIRQTLGLPMLLDIAVGIGRGIEYLHQGCDKRILHLDIKPQNILLDNNFHPKISDFGLAKYYSRKHSTVPLAAVRGTVGYIAPEVFMRNLGGASDRSDVYSYGTLLLEMMVGRKKVDPIDELSSKEYFPNWIYNQLNRWRDMELDDSVVEEDMLLLRKMVMVGLWCIQTKPADRPSISTVLTMLTGRLERLEMPPKPLLFPPPERWSEDDTSGFQSARDTMTFTSESW